MSAPSTTSTRLLRAGADKVSINSAAVARPEFLSEAADRFGSQCVVLAVDARRVRESLDLPVRVRGDHPRRAARAPESTRSSGCGAPRTPDAGEILLTSMDARRHQGRVRSADAGAVRAAVGVPLIASGGAGGLADFPPAIAAGADAVLAASVFHFGALRISQVKQELAAAGYPVRLQVDAVHGGGAP